MNAKTKKYLLILAGALLVALLVFQAVKSSKTTVSTPKASIISLPPKQATQTSGANLKDIKYTLPQGWEAKLSENGLFLSPINEGGYLSIGVYNYPGNIGRREYYCQITKFCIDATYFKEMNIGNIQGYVASALDNSGGGREYFGAKDNKFYIISSFSPPSPNEFDNNYQNVLNSLIF